jgi:hypothetical protein
MMYWFERTIFDGPFTKSNGSIAAKIYERLTRKSRRLQEKDVTPYFEMMYRQGVYDTLKAIEEEVNV